MPPARLDNRPDIGVIWLHWKLRPSPHWHNRGGTWQLRHFPSVDICVKGQIMKRLIVMAGLIGGLIIVTTAEASAVVCARGVYRAGCVAPRGAVVRSGTMVRRGAVGYRSGTAVRRSTVVRRSRY